MSQEKEKEKEYDRKTSNVEGKNGIVRVGDLTHDFDAAGGCIPSEY